MGGAQTTGSGGRPSGQSGRQPGGQSGGQPGGRPDYEQPYSVRVAPEFNLFGASLLSAFVVMVSIAGILFSGYLLTLAQDLAGKIIGSGFLLLMTVGAVANVVGCYYLMKVTSLPDFRIKRLCGNPEKFPTVAVVIPFKNERHELVKKTLSAALEVDYPRSKLSFYLLDNSNERSREIQAFCAEKGVEYAYIRNPVGLKSYALNALVKKLREKYVALLDADDVLFDKNFLLETIPYLEEDETLASVQTFKENAPGGLFANLINAYYSFFYRFTQPVRSLSKSAMFCGSCGVIRRSVVEKIGGFAKTPTEDTAFSFQADLRGYGSVFVPKTYAYGEPISRFKTYVGQQWRYTVGNTRLFYGYLKNFRKFSLEKHVHYLTQTTSFAYLSYPLIFYALFGILFVAMNVFSAASSTAPLGGYGALASAVYTTAVLIMVLVGGRFYFGSYKLGVQVMFLNIAAAFTRAKGVFVALLNLPARFIMTRHIPELRSLGEAMKLTLPETLFSFALLGVGVVALFIQNFIGAFWLVWYAVLFSSPLFFAYFVDVKGKA